MRAEHTRLQLIEQHARIRMHLETCTRLARLADCDDRAGPQLDAALAALREELAAHNEAEAAIIGALLHGPAQWSKLMIDRMFEEHAAEHAAFWELLSGTRAEVAARIEELADELDAHMAAEERTFLAPGTLREDTLRVRTGVERGE
jgi:iron-sulfur cluster repair protein YtfE (RIC family)